MKILRNVDDAMEFTKGNYQKSVGLVPTMGFLHAGHRSLIEEARKNNNIVVVSIFVNPTQFGPNEDYEKYPRDEESDFKLCENAGVDAVFVPDANEFYDNHKTYVTIEDLKDNLCGKTRPIHFRGVLTVLTKLFNIFRPTNAYFGKKDAQQFLIVKKTVKDLNFGINIVPCPIKREDDGLAISSRNVYLSEEERKAAPVLYRALEKGRSSIKKGMRSDDLVKIIRDEIEKEQLAKIEYIQVVDTDEIKDVEIIDRDVLVALAVHFGNTRLIDNFFYEV
ncbi:pantoate--beta-alanine ligase [Peptoniphilus lacydonensis]|jgi:pantoate--beta-alanine ligase|uniref:pantoate--beta-alanine ligase n=1 Tax=Peptoniphilus lacydonensis TaxID=1673725 RepID=UPI0008DA8DEC|nr:pantoate--beta-alanine ligase [Peptoniphilus lacydonensis]